MGIDAAAWAMLILLTATGYMVCVEVAADLREGDADADH